jgi:hypothetical protein
MYYNNLRKAIRKSLNEEANDLRVEKCVEIGLDHLKKYKINLSNNSTDFFEKKNIVVTNSNQADYKCSNLAGYVPSESGFVYEFTGVDCDGYIWLDPKSVKLTS